MSAWSIYERATGRIVGGFEGETDVDLLVVTADGQSAVPSTADPAADYVVDGAIVPRPEMQGFDPRDTTTVPPGTSYLVWNEMGEELRVDGATEPLVLTDAGTYRFLVLPPFPWRRFESELVHA